MKTQIKYISFLLLFVIVISFIVNFVCSTLSPIDIVGNGELWVNYFGSLLGGVVSSGAALFVFYKTIVQTKSEKNYEIESARYEKLVGRLSMIIESLDTNEIMNELERIGYNSQEKLFEYTETTISRFEEKEKEVYHVYHLFELEFCTLSDDKISADAFNSHYRAEKDRVLRTITSLISYLRVINSCNSDSSQKTEANNMINRIVDTLKNNPVDHIFTYARKWLEIEEKRIKELKEEITK